MRRSATSDPPPQIVHAPRSATTRGRHRGRSCEHDLEGGQSVERLRKTCSTLGSPGIHDPQLCFRVHAKAIGGLGGWTGASQTGCYNVLRIACEQSACRAPQARRGQRTSPPRRLGSRTRRHGRSRRLTRSTPPTRRHHGSRGRFGTRSRPCARYGQVSHGAADARFDRGLPLYDKRRSGVFVDHRRAPRMDRRSALAGMMSSCGQRAECWNSCSSW